MKVTLISRTPSPGFGEPLDIQITYNQTLRTILNKLNMYRSPETQIKQVYNLHQQEVPLDVPVRRDTILYIN